MLLGVWLATGLPAPCDAPLVSCFNPPRPPLCPAAPPPPADCHRAGSGEGGPCGAGWRERCQRCGHGSGDGCRRHPSHGCHPNRLQALKQRFPECCLALPWLPSRAGGVFLPPGFFFCIFRGAGCQGLQRLPLKPPLLFVAKPISLLPMPCPPSPTNCIPAWPCQAQAKLPSPPADQNDLPSCLPAPPPLLPSSAHPKCCLLLTTTLSFSTPAVCWQQEPSCLARACHHTFNSTPLTSLLPCPFHRQLVAAPAKYSRWLAALAVVPVEERRRGAANPLFFPPQDNPSHDSHLVLPSLYWLRFRRFCFLVDLILPG